MTGAIYKMDQPMHFAFGAKTNFSFVTIAVRFPFLFASLDCITCYGAVYFPPL
jgi:hypothetical protein